MLQLKKQTEDIKWFQMVFPTKIQFKGSRGHHFHSCLDSLYTELQLLQLTYMYGLRYLTKIHHQCSKLMLNVCSRAKDVQ